MAEMMKKAVIFDLDGTLSDSIHSIKYSGDRTMERFGYGPFSEEQYKYFVGDGAANLVRRALSAGGDTELIHFEEAYALYREIFRENCMYRVRPYEGIPELLAALKAQHVHKQYKIFWCNSNQTSERCLQQELQVSKEKNLRPQKMERSLMLVNWQD